MTKDNQAGNTDRLVPPNEGKHIVGVRSLTTYYGLIKAGELPPLIKRGRNSYHLESELRQYVRRLAETQRAMQGKAA